MAAPAIDWTPALQHLRSVDPKLAPVIERVGAPTIAPERDAIYALARAIVSQQLSGQAAATIFARFLALYPRGKFPRPAALLATDEPVGDLGIKKGMQRHFALRKLPEADRMTKLAAPWRPFRSVAAWYMWRILET